jgi:hypothetical protein
MEQMTTWDLTKWLAWGSPYTPGSSFNFQNVSGTNCSGKFFLTAKSLSEIIVVYLFFLNFKLMCIGVLRHTRHNSI